MCETERDGEKGFFSDCACVYKMMGEGCVYKMMRGGLFDQRVGHIHFSLS